MICPNCGRGLDDDAKFCKVCGICIERQQGYNPTSRVAYEEPVFKEYETFYDERSYRPAPKTSQKSKAIISVLVGEILLVATLIGFVAYTLWGAVSGKLSITVDEYEKSTYKVTYTLQGTAFSEKRDATITIDDEHVANINAGEEKNWSHIVNLDSGENIITVTLTDKKGRVETEKVEIYCEEDVVYRVQAGVFASKDNADRLCADIKSKGFDAIVVKKEDKYRVQAGAFAKNKNAKEFKKELKAEGFEAIIFAERRS